MRTRTLIQVGGMIHMLDFLDLFDLKVGDDLQLDHTKINDAIMMLGYFSDVRNQTPKSFNDEQKKQFLLKGKAILNAKQINSNA